MAHIVIATDNFNRTTGAAIGSNWGTGQEGFSPGIQSNRVTNWVGNQNQEAYWTANSFDNNQYSQMILQQLNTGVDDFSGVVVRGTATDWVIFGVNKANGSVQLLHYDSGAYTVIADDAGASGDPTNKTFLVEVVGQVFTCFLNGTQIFSNTIATAPTSGRPGVYLSGTTARVSLWDSWEGGNIANTITTSSSISVAESVSVAIVAGGSSLSVNVSDAISVTESTNRALVHQINTSDNIHVVDGQTFFIDDFSGTLSNYNQANGTWQITSGVLDPVTETGTNWGNSIILTNKTDYANFEFTADVQKGTNNSQIVFRSGSSSGTGYGIQLRNDLVSQSFRLENWGNSNLQEANIGFPWVTGNWYTVRIQMIGNVIKARAWPRGTAEPSTWPITYTDASNLFTSGAIGFSNEDSLDANFDNLNIYTNPNLAVVAGPTTLSVSVSDSISASESINRALVHTIQASDTVAVADNRINLFPNPSFEVDTSLWGLDADFTRVTSDSFSGSASVKQVSTTGFNNLTTENDAPSGIPVLPNKPYTLSFYYKMAINSGSGVNIEIHDDTPYGGNTLTTDSITTNAAGWTRKVLTFNSASATKVWFRLYNNNGDLTAFYDAFQLEIGDLTAYHEGTSALVTATLTSNINKSESITVAESTAISTAGPLSINTSDSITVSETVRAQLESKITVSDSLSVSEATHIDIPLNIAVSEAITVSEAVSLTESTLILNISTSDSISITEAATMQSESNISVNDVITVAEQTQASMSITIISSETIGVTESVNTIEPFLAVQTQDSVSLSEANQHALTPLNVSTSDGVAVTENPVIFQELYPLVFTVADSISLSENLAMNPPHFPDPPPKLILVDGNLAILLIDTSVPIYTLL